MLKRFIGVALCVVMLAGWAGTALAQDEGGFFRETVVSKRDAVMLSAIFPGLGQMTQAQAGKGVSFFLGEAVSLILFINANENYDTKQKLYESKMTEFNQLAKNQGSSDIDARALYNDLKSRNDDLDNLNTLRNVAIIAAAGVYAYNLLDVILFTPSTTESKQASIDAGKLYVRSAMIDRTPGIMLSKRF